jgi:hypothetical protein
MGEVIQFPIVGDIDFRRAVRGVEQIMREMLANGPQLMTKVRRATEHITTDTAHFDEAQYNLRVRFVTDRVMDRVYLAFPGDEAKVPNSDGQYSYLELRREG